MENVNSSNLQVSLHSKYTCTLSLFRCIVLGLKEYLYSRSLDWEWSFCCYRIILILTFVLNSSCLCNRSHQSIFVIQIHVWVPFWMSQCRFPQRFWGHLFLQKRLIKTRLHKDQYNWISFYLPFSIRIRKSLRIKVFMFFQCQTRVLYCL